MSDSASLPLKIVVVEDELTMQMILKKYLGSLYQVELFSDGLEALSYLQHGNLPDLIISDLNTPEMGGLELTKQVRASGFFGSIPIIILSGEESSEKSSNAWKQVQTIIWSNRLTPRNSKPV